MRNLEKTYIEILEEADIKKLTLNTSRGKLLKSAIENRNTITFWYTGPRSQTKAGRRINAEAVALGDSKKGRLLIRAWVQPPSVSKTGFEKGGWRTFIVSRMSNITVNDDTFNEKRPGYKEGDESSQGPMVRTYVTSKWGDEKTEPTPTPSEPETVNVEPLKPIEPEVTKRPDASTEPNDIPLPTKEPQREKIQPVTKDVETDGLTHSEPLVNKSNELPQPKPIVKPPVKPIENDDEVVDDEDENNVELQENIKRIKQLLYN